MTDHEYDADEVESAMARPNDEDEPLCYGWCGFGIGLCLRGLGHVGDCSPIPDPIKENVA